MGILVLICGVVGLFSLLGGAIKATGEVSVALLRYVIGPVAILAMIIGCICCAK